MMKLSVNIQNQNNFRIELYYRSLKSEEYKLQRVINIKNSIFSLERSIINDTPLDDTPLVKLFDNSSIEIIEEHAIRINLGSDDSNKITIDIHPSDDVHIYNNFKIGGSVTIECNKNIYIDNLKCGILFMESPKTFISGLLEVDEAYSDYEIENSAGAVAYINKIGGNGVFINKGILNMDILAGVSSGSLISISIFKTKKNNSKITTFTNLTITELNKSFKIGRDTELRVGGILHFEGYGSLGSNAEHYSSVRNNFILKGCAYSKSANVYRAFYNYGNFYSRKLNQVGKLENTKGALIKVNALTTRWNYTNFGEIDVEERYHNANLINKGVLKVSILRIPHSKSFKNEGLLASVFVENLGEFISYSNSTIKSYDDSSERRSILLDGVYYFLDSLFVKGNLHTTNTKIIGFRTITIEDGRFTNEGGNVCCEILKCQDLDNTVFENIPGILKCKYLNVSKTINNLGTINSYEITAFVYDGKRNSVINCHSFVVYSFLSNHGFITTNNLSGDTKGTTTTNNGAEATLKIILKIHSINFENHGTLVIENVIDGSITNMKNFGTTYINNCIIQFHSLENYKHLIFESGKYVVSEIFINKGLLSFLGEWLFSESMEHNLNNTLILLVNAATSYISTSKEGDIESEKLTYNQRSSPKSIIATKSIIYYIDTAKFRSLEDLKNTKSPVVFFYTHALKVSEDITLDNINFLSWHNKDTLQINATIITQSVQLYSDDIIFGLSATKAYGTIAAVKDCLIIENKNAIDARCGKIYGSTRLNIKAMGNITTGEIVHQLPTHYVSNSSYIASNGPIIIDCGSLNVDCGNITTSSTLLMKSKNNIVNVAGKISAKSISVEAVSYDHIRSEIVTIGNVQYSPSGPAIIESLEDITFKCSCVKNIASDILCGGKLFIKNKLAFFEAGEPLKNSSKYSETPIILSKYIAHSPHVIIYPRSQPRKRYLCGEELNFLGRANILYDWKWIQYSTLSCNIKTAEGVNINMGDVTITGNINSSIIKISSNTSSFHNASVSRENYLQNDIYVDMNVFIKKNSSGIFLEKDNGELISDFPIGIPSENSSGNSSGNSSSFFFNPLRSLDLNPWIQRALSEFSGKTFVRDIFGNKIKGNNLYEKLYSKESKKTSRVYTLEENSTQKTILYIPKNEVSEYQSNGDIVCDEFSSVSESTQSFTNNRIVARDILKVLSEEGNIHRNTQKYGVNYFTDNGTHISTEYAYPQQSFICGGDIEIKGENLQNIGVTTLSGGNIEETSSVNGSISKSPLILNTRTHREWSKDGWFSSKTYSENTSYSTVVPTQTISMKNIKESAQRIHLVGAVEHSIENILYEGGEFLSEPCVMHYTQSLKTQTQGLFSGGYSSNENSTPYTSSSEIHAKNITFNSKISRVCGTRISAKLIRDVSHTGLEFLPAVHAQTYSQKVYHKSPMSTMDIGNSGWKEIMFPCNIVCEKIIRDAFGAEGCIKFDSVIWGDVLKPEIVGKYLETYYILKSHHEEYNHSSQVIPDGFIVVAALAISFFTMGLGAVLTGLSGFAGCIANAVVTSVLVNTGTTFLKTGDITQSVESLFTKEYLKSLGVSVATAGILGDPSNAYSSFLNRLGDNFLRNVVNASVSKVIANDKISLMPKNIIKNTLINSVAGEAAKSIGGYASSKSVTFRRCSKIQQKTAHFALGSAMGFASGGNLRSALGGGLGVLASELLADYFLENEFIKDPLKASQLSTLISACTCALLKGDVNSVIQTSVNAFENNRMMHLSPESGKEIEYLDEDDINDFVDEELRNFVLPGKKIKKMVNILEKEKALDYPTYSKKYIMSYDSNEFSDDFSLEKWITVDSPLERIRKIVDRSMYNFSNIPNKSLSELSPHEYFGLAPVYTLKTIAATDDFFGGYAQKLLGAVSKCTTYTGNISRDVTYYISGNASLSQDIGYTTTFALDTLLPIKGVSTVKVIPKINGIMGKKIMSYNPEYTLSGVKKWSTKNIFASQIMIFDKEHKLNSLLSKRITREPNAPLIIISHGSYKEMAIISDKMIIPKPSFNFKNTFKERSHKIILPNREFPVSCTPAKNIKYESVELSINHRNLAKYISKNISPDIKKINEASLYSCYVGMKDFSQNLSNKMNIPIHAPTSALNINYLFGTFEVVDIQFINGVAKVDPTKKGGILKTFLPRGKAAQCIIPVIPSTIMYYGPEIPISKNDEIVPFVKDGADGLWYEGCISGDMNLTNRNSGVSKSYESLKEKNIIFKSEKCMFNISAHGSKDYIFIEDSTDIDNGILNFVQDAEIKVDGQTQVDAQQFADILRNSSKYKSNIVKHINLFACECGKDIDGIAQNLSDEMQVSISAFTGLAMTNKKYFASVTRESNMYIVNKEIKIFYPRPKQELSDKYNIYDLKYKKSIFDE